MDPDTIKEAIDSGNITLLHEFINNEVILQKYVDGDPRAFYDILTSAINVNRDHLKLDDVNKIYDDLILQLIKAAKQVHFGLFDGETLLTQALDHCMSYDIIIELLKAGSDVNAATRYGSPLSNALDKRNGIKVIAELINRGADVNCRDNYGWTPLFSGMCFQCEHPDLILLLLNSGSNVHNIDNKGKNVLMFRNCYCVDGSDCKAKESIDMLIKYGINDLDFKHTDKDGNTVLHNTYCKYVFELAVKAGVSIEAKNNKGWTPLLKDLRDDGGQKFFYLLKCGANIHSTDPKLHTVLHLYILFNFAHLVEPGGLDMLIYHGGNVYARNINNETPLDIIIETCQFSCYDNGNNIVDFLADEFVYVIPKHVILFDDYGFDIAREALENLNNGVAVSTFINACKEELNVMRETFIKDGLTFYEFCILKRYYKNKCVNIAPNEYKYSFDDISNLFPLYKNIIIIRIKDNRRKNHDLDIRRAFERVIFHPVNTTETDYSELLNYDCLYHMSQYLNFKDMFNVFSAAIES